MENRININNYDVKLEDLRRELTGEKFKYEGTEYYLEFGDEKGIVRDNTSIAGKLNNEEEGKEVGVYIHESEGGESNIGEVIVEDRGLTTFDKMNKSVVGNIKKGNEIFVEEFIERVENAIDNKEDYDLSLREMFLKGIENR